MSRPRCWPAAFAGRVMAVTVRLARSTCRTSLWSLAVAPVAGCHAASPREAPQPTPARPAVARDTLIDAIIATATAGSASFVTVGGSIAMFSLSAAAPDSTPRRVVLLDEFVPVQPAEQSGGECREFALPMPSTVMKSVGYPTLRNPQTSIMLTADTAGNLLRYSERRGSPGVRVAPGEALSAAQLDSMRRAALAAKRVTSIELDYESNMALLRNTGGGMPDDIVMAPVSAVEHRDRLGRPGDRAKKAIALCGGLRPAPIVAPPPPPPGASPETVLQTFFDALHAKAWKLASSLVEPGAIAEYRSASIRSLLGWADNVAKTRSDTGARNLGYRWPNDTSLLATYDTVSLPGLGRPLTLGGLARLPAVELYAIGLQSQYDRVREVTPHILGTVLEGDSLAHVLYRNEFTGFGVVTSMRSLDLRTETAHLRRVGLEWRLATEANVTGSATAISYRVMNAMQRR